MLVAYKNITSEATSYTSIMAKQRIGNQATPEYGVGVIIGAL
jgi:hypothetical protein